MAEGSTENAELVRLADERRKRDPDPVHFDRRELGALLQTYSKMVGAGEWRDYAIDQLRDRAVFSVFRRTSEMPLFRIEKIPAQARKQTPYQIVGEGGQILKRGNDLPRLLDHFDKVLRVALAKREGRIR